MANLSRQLCTGIGCVVEYLDSEQFLGEAAKWSALSLQVATVPMIIKGFIAHTGLPLVMTLPTVCVFAFRSRYGWKKQLLTNQSDYIGLLVWSILGLQSITFKSSIF
ncbi:hypothetical protein [Leptolyngbya sp. FACHB-261]|uniref:hypothetical protein n=1 Tax=Leptolyngbya sp. FACHB-261 TaxID=2692806 RepID=UPI001684C981|nr:hypothetical protein [Leptolyngbya sp. FACHB-261]MBD2104936.1 hypothetical protein [Leptolyngbya sp. FACHB-261]